MHYSLKRWICRTCSKSSWLSFVKSEKKTKKKKTKKDISGKGKQTNIMIDRLQNY